MNSLKYPFWSVSFVGRSKPVVIYEGNQIRANLHLADVLIYNSPIHFILIFTSKPAEDLSESVERVKRAKTEVCSLFGYNHPLSNPAFVTNLTAAFHSHVQKHGKPDTRWKHWKGIGLVALRETYEDFDKCPKECTSLGNRVKTMLVKLGLLG